MHVSKMGGVKFKIGRVKTKMGGVKSRELAKDKTRQLLGSLEPNTNEIVVRKKQVRNWVYQ